jgi:hydrogenase maturation protein HypF
MQKFEMCPDCREEYHNVEDRRFHAQPVACNFCGPQYAFYQGGRIIKDTYKILKELKRLLYRGKIIAVKGVGGFQLICDATNNRVVERLRKLKNRDRKPFAVMFSDLDNLQEYAYVSAEEKEQLLSWRRPIVLLQQKQVLAESINNGLSELGVLFPYMPLHFLIFEEIDMPALVFTSANLSDEPILADNDKAMSKLEHVADAFLVYNREIHNRTDDSVIRMLGSQVQQIRRSRGYVPSPVPLNFDVSGILATGAELKNTFALGIEKQAIVSQHIGDLKNYETYEFFGDAVNRFLHLFHQQPHTIVSDLHPDYMSTRFAKNFHAKLEKQGTTKGQWIQVQHHHAHIASCMTENNLTENVIGIALDGTGYGEDGNIWGGEFFKANLCDYQRFAHFEYVPMPGGDKAINSPWRMALSFLANAFDNEGDFIDLPFLKDRPTEDIKLILSMIRKGLNSPLTSSAGRVFDAVAAMVGICTEACFEAEPPMRLEAIIMESVDDYYSYSFEEDVVSFLPTFREIVDDLRSDISPGAIAAKFHNTVTTAVVEGAKEIRKDFGLNKVVLSGGTFQNKYLTERVIRILKEEDFEVFTHTLVPCNDGGISLGQLAIAAHK